MSHNFFRGVSIEQSGRMGGDAKLKKKLKVAAVCDVKVSMAKVKLIIISKWVSQRITELLGFEDEVVINFIVNFLEAAEVPDAKQLQLDLTGFLEKQAGLFVEELWTLLVDAQKNKHGIPSVFLEKKKQELASAKKSRFEPIIGDSVQDQMTGVKSAQALVHAREQVAAAMQSTNSSSSNVNVQSSDGSNAGKSCRAEKALSYSSSDKRTKIGGVEHDANDKKVVVDDDDDDEDFHNGYSTEGLQHKEKKQSQGDWRQRNRDKDYRRNSRYDRAESRHYDYDREVRYHREDRRRTRSRSRSYSRSRSRERYTKRSSRGRSDRDGRRKRRHDGRKIYD